MKPDEKTLLILMKAFNDLERFGSTEKIDLKRWENWSDKLLQVAENGKVKDILKVREGIAKAFEDRGVQTGFRRVFGID